MSLQLLGDIDFLTHYKLVDPGLIETYARAFVVEDDNFDTVISAKVTSLVMNLCITWS